MSNTPPPSPPPPPSGELFQFVLQQVAHLTSISRSGGSPEFRVTVPGISNNLVTSQRLAYNLLGHLHNLNAAESERIWRSLTVTEENRRQAVSELLLAYLYEVEALCDHVNADMDHIVHRFTANQEQYQASEQPLHPGAIITPEIALNWRQSLYLKVVQLRTARLVLVDLAERFPIDATYRMENVLIPIHHHLAATFVNTKMVVNDAKLLMQALTWYANVMRYMMTGGDNGARQFA